MALTIEQRKERRKGIGGSDIAAILGINKWQTALDVYLEKVSTEEPYEEQKPIVGFNPMEWGNRMEPILIKKFEEATSKSCASELETFVHKQYDYMRANIDAKIIGENAILECKTAGQFVAKEWSTLGGDNIPEPYLLQCAYYAEVLDIDRVYIAVLIGGNDFRIYEYNRNPSLGKLILAKVSEFWNNHVLKQIPPTPRDLTDSCKLWKYTISENTKTVTEDIQIIIKDMHMLKNQARAIKDLYEEKQMQVCEFLKEDIALLDNNGHMLLTWKPQTVSKFDSKAFQQDYPELYGKYIKTNELRSFKLKGEIE